MPKKEYQIRFTDEQRVAIAERIRGGIDGELCEENADEMVEAVGRLIADKIKEEGDADVVIQGWRQNRREVGGRDGRRTHSGRG